MTLPEYGQPIVRLVDVDLSILSIAGQAAGDIIFFDGAQWNRRAVGNNNDVLVVTGGVPVWSPTLTDITLAGTPTAAGATWTDLGNVLTADIDGGSIDATIIGAAVPLAITGVTIDATTDFTVGNTVITDGVLTDVGGFQFATTVDMLNNPIGNIGVAGQNIGATGIVGIGGVATNITGTVFTWAAGGQMVTTGNNDLTIGTPGGTGDLLLQANGSTLVAVDGGTDTVGIGGIVSTVNRLQSTWTITSDPGADRVGIRGQTLRAGAFADTNLYTGVAGRVAGTSANSGTNTATIGARGVQSVLGFQSTGDWTGVAGFYAAAATKDGGVTIGTEYGLYVETMTVAGTSIGISTANGVDLRGTSSGIVSVAVAADAGTWTMTLPVDNGDAGEQLQTNGAGVTSWEAAGSLAAFKAIHGVLAPADALDAILGTRAVLFRYRDKTLDGKRPITTGDYETEYAGVLGDDAPWVMHHGGRIFSPVSAFGYTVAAFQAIQEEIDNLREHVVTCH